MINKKAYKFPVPKLNVTDRQQIATNWWSFERELIQPCFEIILNSATNTTGRKLTTSRLIIRLNEEWEDLKPGITLEVLEGLYLTFADIKSDWYQYYRNHALTQSNFAIDRVIMDQYHNDYLVILNKQIEVYRTVAFQSTDLSKQLEPPDSRVA